MTRPRLIPVLLMNGGRLVKTRRFGDPKYVGDPINVVRIFNEKEVDELVVLDIGAARTRSGPDFDLVGRLASEAFMPVCYGGGVASVDAMRALYRLGVEKVSLNTAAFASPSLVAEAAAAFGRQSVVVSIDAKRSLLGRYEVKVAGGRRHTGLDPVAFARSMAAAGAGELLVNSIDRDGTRSGYDLELLRRVVASVDVPVVACGGADGDADFRRALAAGASACGAGSAFVFQARTGAVLISYPSLSTWTEP